MGPGPHRQFSGVSLNLLRNKRNIALDIKHPDGRTALLRVAATCDAFVTNLRPGTLQRARLDYAALAEARPDIVYCQAHGFPTGTPRQDDPAYDDIMQVETGVADAAARISGEPAMAPTLMADKVSGLTIVYAVIAGLFRRERTGLGEHIEVPMADVVTSWMLVEHGAAAVARPPQGRAGYPRILIPDRRPRRTLDGWIAVLPYSKRHYEAIFTGTGREDLIADGRYDTGHQRIANAAALYEEVGQILATRTTAEWLAFCREADVPAAAVASLDDLVDRLPEAEHPVAGRYKVVPPPVRFAGAPANVRRPAPLIGQHTEEVLAEAGYDQTAIAKLRQAGALPGLPSEFA
jgi:crotonobetainyl-CoA:carnitine CoA-transferase CaiB-like acyl-CoA transferase